ncbi:electron transfer flavoprotein subunit beta/FixA family protein [Nonomuraea pusilla]|uniref:Electron transfer flavoprotein beta subunit n=1 Tax=Nonomuraea pusilla TaxID=46177 RepID=A0A1H7Y9E6_9ACTN|nr:electron transfer flavoprotein subunit beta/FixA family protein [Nonomuraea pusilla]SEM42575.1 electron transfer flavoprotein beta subunit [Nonomuraea pusilla]
MLTILVPVKDVSIHLRVKEGRLTRQGVPRRLDSLHETPLEWARRARESGLAARVVAMTLGPAGAADALRRTLALGADEAILVSDHAFEGADVRTTARVIAAVAGRVGAGLVACGYESADGSSGAVPGAVAGSLGWPLLSRAGLATVDGTSLTVTRDLGSGPERAAAPLPAVVSFVEGAIEPRVPTLREIMAVRSAGIVTLSSADVGVRPAAANAVDTGVTAAPASRRTPTVLGFDDGVDSLVALLSGAGSDA